MQLKHYLEIVARAEKELSDALEKVGRKHASDIDVLQTCKVLASWSKDHVENIRMQIKKYEQKTDNQAADLSCRTPEAHMGALGLLKDLHRLWLMTCEVEISYIIIIQAAKALRDKDLELACEQFCMYTNRQKAWLQTKIKTSSSQTLIAAN